MKNRLREAAQEVHNVLGPGYTESIYHRALERELSERQIPFTSEGTIPVMYRGAPVGRRRPDLFIIPEVGDTIVVELKANSAGGELQLDEYLKLADADSNLGQIRGGVVIRFNEELEFDFVELGEQESDWTIEQVNELPNGLIVYHVERGEHEAQLMADPAFEHVSIEHDAAKKGQHERAFGSFLDAAKERVYKQEFGNDTEEDN